MSRRAENQQLALPADRPEGPERGEEQPESGGARAMVLAPIIRHWLMVLLVWILVAGAAVPYIWLTKKPSFTATAQIKVDPILSGPLDRQMQTIPLFESFVASQASLLSSKPVLERALADPRVQRLQADHRPRAIAGLRASLLIKPAARTQIIELSVSSPHDEAAIALTDAVLDAYLALYGGTAKLDSDLEFIRGKEKVIEAELATLRVKRRELAGEFSADTDSMLEKLRERDMKSNEQSRQELDKIDLEIIRLEQDLEDIEMGRYSPVTELSGSEVKAAVDRDAAVSALEKSLQDETSYLIKRRGGMTADDVKKLEKKIEQLKADLEKARADAAASYEKSQREFQQKLKQNQIQIMQDNLERTKSIRGKIAERIRKQEEDDRRKGQVGIELEAIDEQIEKQTTELDRFQTARKSLMLRKDQPGPGLVSKASAAEILADGYSDKRQKLTIAAVFGSLFLGMFVAIVRGRLDARMHAPEEVAAAVGLQILGAVPAINDLKKGRITEEEFAEAYRILRVSILSRAWGEPPKSILITSAQAREGKTSLALSLSVSLAELGKRVLLIDADLQAPKIGNLLGIDAPSKLQYVLSGSRDLASSTVSSRLSNVDVLLGGANAEGGLVGQQAADKLIREASAKYDYVIVDSSPALGSADALVWSQAVDRVVVSTLLGSSDIHATQSVCQRLALVGAKVLGAVVCNVPVRGGFTSCTSTYRSYTSSRSRRGPGDVLYLPVMRNSEDEQ